MKLKFVKLISIPFPFIYLAHLKTTDVDQSALHIGHNTLNLKIIKHNETITKIHKINFNQMQERRDKFLSEI